MKRFFILVLLIFGLVHAVASCQKVSGENLYLYLDNNIDANGQECITIEGKNITFDCNGYQIHNASTAILVKKSTNVKILNCNITDSKKGIWIGRIMTSGSPTNMTVQNESRNNTVENASIINCTIGIELFKDNGSVVSHTTVSNSSTGIYLKTSYHETIKNSTLSDNENGIILNNSVKFNDVDNYPERNYAWNTVQSNYIINNNIGIVLFYSGMNSFYNNYFNNTNNVDSNSLIAYQANSWNTSYDCSSPSIINGMCRGGNFWSDYYGYDSGEGGAYPHDQAYDGIGDTSLPYMPSGEVMGDDLPLTKNIPPNWISECRNITSMGTYVIKKDIYGVMSETDHRCLNILAPNVEINCYGYSIIDNTTYDDTYGVYVDGYSNLILKNCSVINYTTGLYERDSTYGTLAGNNFSNDLYNIYLDYDVNYPPQIEVFFKNITTDNFVDGKRIYYFLNGKTGDGYAPPAPNDAGLVAYVNTNDAYITGQDLEKNSPVIILVNVSNGLVEKTNVDTVGDGVYSFLSRNISILNNNISNINRYAIPLTNTNSTTISENRIENGTGNSLGVYAYSPNNISISYNNASNLWLFAYVESSAGYADVFNNTAYVTYRACAFSDVPGARVYGNTFVGTEYGPNLIVIAGFPNGQIFNNTLLGHAQKLAGIIFEPGLLLNDNISIYNNVIIGNETDFSYESVGIKEEAMASNVKMYNNTIKNLMHGIHLDNVLSNLTIFNNTIYNTSVGILLTSCICDAPFPGCIDVYSNNISIFTQYGISADSPPQCSRIFYNNYIYNLFGSLAHGDLWTYWNISKNCSRGPNILGGPCWGGNSWKPFTGLCDSDGDGISEYEFYLEGGVDWLPITDVPCKSRLTKIHIKEKNITLALPTRIKIKR